MTTRLKPGLGWRFAESERMPWRQRVCRRRNSHGMSPNVVEQWGGGGGTEVASVNEDGLLTDLHNNQRMSEGIMEGFYLSSLEKAEIGQCDTAEPIPQHIGQIQPVDMHHTVQCMDRVAPALWIRTCGLQPTLTNNTQPGNQQTSLMGKSLRTQSREEPTDEKPPCRQLGSTNIHSS